MAAEHLILQISTGFYKKIWSVHTFKYSSLRPIIPRSVTISNLEEFDARTCVPDGRCNYEPAPVPARVSIEKGREEERACSNQNSILRVTFWPVVARLVFPFQPVDPPFRFFSGRASQWEARVTRCGEQLRPDTRTTSVLCNLQRTPLIMPRARLTEATKVSCFAGVRRVQRVTRCSRITTSACRSWFR